MNESLKDALATILTDIMHNHESDFEMVLDEYGVESIEADNHIYNLARILWCEFELDLSEA